MESLKFNLNQAGNKFKPLNATNGTAWFKRHLKDQLRSNYADYKAARIPYSRNHDSAIKTIYGGPYSHDISNIFRDFDADPEDPNSYDFACTDEEILKGLDTGTETYFRLGQSIEHQIVKHFTNPPKDFKKWAVICEHIIAHYNEGWANGFHHNIQYWEIWNEPDNKSFNHLTNSWVSATWGGTKEEFIDFFEIAAKHLKSKFPNIKIGGPAFSEEAWSGEFLCEMQKRNVALDFFSWHIYCKEPRELVKLSNRMRELLDKYGYTDTESHLNEWNYIKGWTDLFKYSIKQMISLKGSSFILSCISEAQHAPVDILMYYDTRPSAFNGVFDFYTYEKLKGYYPLYWYGMFYDCVKEIPCDTKLDDIYTLCGVKEDGKILATVTHYTDKDFDSEVADKTVTLDFGRSGNFEIYLLDNEHDGELVNVTENLEITLPVHTSILIKEI